MDLTPDPTLTPGRLQLLQDRFEKALELDPDQIPSYVASVSQEDPELARQLESLLQAHAEVGADLERPEPAAVAEAVAQTDDRWIGARVGVYQIARRIGIGGMGTVYEAFRADDQFRQRVAIKFLRHHAATELARHQFRTERQILADLSHRNIAALLDGGLTPDGQPFFAMEYVEGQPITQWSDQRRLSVEERLQLFRQVCGAVHAAHQSLVVHRDLKPGNIMVADDGTVKLLDFGIAKLLRAKDPADALPETQVGTRAFTPEYASPEQIRGRPIDTRSDIYSLGVVLFELLAGVRPFDGRGRTLADMERLVCEEPAPRPSAALTPERARRLGGRSTGRGQSQIAGDLDAIVGRALRKEPDRRYGSVQELALDLENHLSGRPVLARPDSRAYWLGKLLRRHRVEAAALLLVLGAAATGGVATARKAQEATRERDRANEVKSFLTSMLGAAAPGVLGKDVKVREVLDSAAGRANGLADQPELAAEIHTVIGNTYLALGEFELAEAEYRHAIAGRRRLAPGGDFQTAAAMTDLAGALENQGRYGAADSVATNAAELAARFPPPKPLQRASLLDTRARILIRLGRMAEAAPLMREALAINRVEAPDDHSGLAYAYGNLGNVTAELGDLAAAETLFVAGLAAAQRAEGERRPRIAEALALLAVNRDRLGEADRADSAYQASLAIRRELLGAGHPDYALGAMNYAGTLVIRGEFVEAARMAREVLEYRGRSIGDAHPAMSTAMQVLGKALDGLDSLAAGERWLRESLAVREANYPAGHWLIASSASVLGEHFVRARRYSEAEQLLVTSERALLEARGETAPVMIDARKRLVLLYQAWGRTSQAAAWLAKIPPAAR